MRSSNDQQPLDYEAKYTATLALFSARLRSAFHAAPGHVRFGFPKPMKKWKLGRRGAAFLLTLIAGMLLFGVAGIARWRTLQARQQSATQLAGEQEIAFALQPLDPASRSHFEPVSAPAI